MSIAPISSRHSLDSIPPSARVDRQARSVAVSSQASPLGRGWLIVWTLFAAGLLALVATRASAQAPQYDSIPMHEALQDENTVKRVQTATRNYANSGQGNPASVNGYFAYYIPAKITAPDGVKHITELIGDAKKLLGRAERANRGQVVQVLSRFIFDGMKKVAEGNHHPAARINAIQMLAMLNTRPANPQAKTPPIPMLRTLPVMLAIYQDTNNPDGVRAAALQGIRRHVMYGFPQISAQDQSAITALATELLDSEAPQGRPAKAHAYLQRFAVDILDILRSNEDKSLAVKLVSISTKPENPDLIALYSAARLGSMSSDLQGQVENPKDVLESWTRRALEAFEADLARLQYLDRPTISVTQPQKPERYLQKRTTETARRARTAEDMEMMMDYEGGMDMEGMMEDMEDMGMDEMDMEEMGGMMGMMGMLGQPEAKPQPPEVRVSRRSLNLLLQQIHLGVTGNPAAGMPSRNPGGLLASVAEEDKPVVEQWITEMEPIVTALNDKTLDSRTKYIEGLEAQIVVLRELLGEGDEAAPELPDDLQPVDPLDELGVVDELAG